MNCAGSSQTSKPRREIRSIALVPRNRVPPPCSDPPIMALNITTRPSGYAKHALSVSGASQRGIKAFEPTAEAESGVSFPRYQCATSTTCVNRSVSAPPPKSQYQRHC